MNLFKPILTLVLFSTLFLNHPMAKSCESFLSLEDINLQLELEKFILTPPNDSVSINSRALVEAHFTNILVASFIEEHRPDLAYDRELALNLISADINDLKNAMEFYRAILYARFEKIKELSNSENPYELALFTVELLEIYRILHNLPTRLLE